MQNSFLLRTMLFLGLKPFLSFFFLVFHSSLKLNDVKTRSKERKKKIIYFAECSFFYFVAFVDENFLLFFLPRLNCQNQF